jgi:hypothetical protein
MESYYTLNIFKENQANHRLKPNPIVCNYFANSIMDCSIRFNIKQMSKLMMYWKFRTN